MTTGVGRPAWLFFTPSIRFNPAMEAEARRPAPTGNISNLEEGIVPGRQQGRGEAQYSLPRRIVQYSRRFKLFMIVIASLSLAWCVNFFINVNPLLEEDEEPPDCRYAVNQLKYNARVLFFYFMWFVTARASLFVPCILARVAIVQSRTHGFCRTYCVHLLIRDGPIYIFTVGSVLFWFNILRSPNCENRSPLLYDQLKIYAVCSCLLASACIVEVYWHNKLIANTMDVFSTWASRSAPPDTLEKLQTIIYEENNFGDEEMRARPILLNVPFVSAAGSVTMSSRRLRVAMHFTRSALEGGSSLHEPDLVQLTNERRRAQPAVIGTDTTRTGTMETADNSTVVVVAY
eukprot:symbB.v1.2.004785.t1/scaffold274.1/size244435/26